MYKSFFYKVFKNWDRRQAQNKRGEGSKKDKERFSQAVLLHPHKAEGIRCSQFQGMAPVVSEALIVDIGL